MWHEIWIDSLETWWVATDDQQQQWGPRLERMPSDIREEVNAVEHGRAALKTPDGRLWWHPFSFSVNHFVSLEDLIGLMHSRREYVEHRARMIIEDMKRVKGVTLLEEVTVVALLKLLSAVAHHSFELDHYEGTGVIRMTPLTRSCSLTETRSTRHARFVSAA